MRKFTPPEIIEPKKKSYGEILKFLPEKKTNEPEKKSKNVPEKSSHCPSKIEKKCPKKV